MDSQTRFILGICILLPLLLVINLALLAAFRKRKQPNDQRMEIKARNSLQQPWREEDEQLAELSKRVAEFKEKQAGSGSAYSPENKE